MIGVADLCTWILVEMEVEGPTQAAEPVEEKKPEAASPQQSRAQYFSIAHGDWRNTQGGVDQRIMGCQRDTRLFRLGARCSETNMTNPWHTQWFLYIYLTSGSRISGAVPIFRHPCMLPVKHSMVRQPQQKQVRQAQQLRPKLCDSQLLVTRCHESTTEGPSDSLGEKLPITQDIWVHWAQTRFLGVGPPEFIRTFLQDSWAVPIKSCQEGCGGTCSINPARGREAGGAPVVWECSFSTDCKSHWVNCQILDKFYPNDRKQVHLQLAFLHLQRRSRRHIQTDIMWYILRSMNFGLLFWFPGAQLDIANQFKG